MTSEREIFKTITVQSVHGDVMGCLAHEGSTVMGSSWPHIAFVNGKKIWLEPGAGAICSSNGKCFVGDKEYVLSNDEWVPKTTESACGESFSHYTRLILRPTDDQ